MVRERMYGMFVRMSHPPVHISPPKLRHRRSFKFPILSAAERSAKPSYWADPSASVGMENKEPAFVNSGLLAVPCYFFLKL